MSYDIFYWLLLTTFTTLYSLLQRIITCSNLAYRLYMSLLMQNRQQKVEACIDQLAKKPIQIVISISTNDKMSTDRIRYELIYNLIRYLEIIHNASTNSSIVVYFFGQQAEKCRQDLQSIRSQLPMESSCQRVLIETSSQYENIKETKPLRRKITPPLVICMSNYKSVNCLPFKYLIDAELVFCPALPEFQVYDIQRCFQQYCHSNQRNGK